MKLRTKILLAIWGVVLGLLLVTYFVITYWMRVQLESRFSEDLKSNYSAVTELEEYHRSEIVRSCQIVAESPRLKALVEIRDRNTVVPLCQELNQNMKSELFILRDSLGYSLATLIDGKNISIPKSSIATLVDSLPNGASTGIWQWNHEAFRYASVPLVIGNETVGSLTMGFRLHPVDILAIKSTINSDVVLCIDTVMVTSTLAPGQASEIAVWLKSPTEPLTPRRYGGAPEVFTIQTPHDRFPAAWCRLDRGDAAETSAIGLLLLKPIESEVQSVIVPALRTFIALSIIILIVTAGIGFVISQGITRPIGALIKGTSEVSNGNYDYPIRVGGGGEMKYLAQRFEQMSQSLKEKISQLAERNTELEAALQQLKDTQAELVKSERLAVTGNLTAQLSHEINNPIHNIQSCLQTVLKRTPAASADQELLSVALEEAERLAKLTRQMLDVYRNSVVPLAREPLNLNDVLQDVALSCAPSLHTSNISLRLNLDTSTLNIAGSRDKLKQVFLNLIRNSQDAMPGGGSLLITSKKLNGSAVVDVADTGSGIPPEHLHRIFDAFFTTKSTVSGVGLGLFVTYGIVKQHDGSISVRSTVGEGTTFTLSFPFSPG
ncbi:MAG TPA: HAMP domain-containing sensor histidine kinase [Bacteroidota bacterium]|nr:HAMP domain-containing sensor histidine kinase [Bacteroidota bacterium]